MRLPAGFALAILLFAALPAEASGPVPDSCPHAAVECAQAVSVLELGACFDCCIPCPPISDAVFFKNEAEAIALASVARAQDELARLPASSPTPGRVAAPLTQFATGSAPAFVDEASWKASDTAARVVAGLA